MKHQVAAVFLILCFTSAAVNANAAVDAVVEQLKSLVREFVPDQAKAQEYLSAIDGARECLTAAKDFNPKIVQQLADSAIPTAIECGGRHIGIRDPVERATAIRGCLVEKANSFKQSIGMTPEEIKLFDDASACIQDKTKGLV
ncbi:uncharacterized protein LOC119466233 isoform X3 [Dermacentor silvarum]|uniref:uncharacterized protein LOC119466233 isoform X3 n=1 Tax=Dermacentor silvarum TaxID=543639 RepID=UPI002100CB5F|nr:uncharacterized protein LOC119466233 isoform X3 [Dermacentor silvarum]